MFQTTAAVFILVIGILSIGLVGCASRGSTVTKPAVQKEVIEEGMKPNEATQGVLDQLKKAGSNLDKPHHLEFQFYFSTRGYAEKAAEELEKQGFHTEQLEKTEGLRWWCTATKNMVPKYDQIVVLEQRLRSIARKYHGRYDGFEAAIRK